MTFMYAFNMYQTLNWPKVKAKLIVKDNVDTTLYLLQVNVLVLSRLNWLLRLHIDTIILDGHKNKHIAYGMFLSDYLPIKITFRMTQLLFVLLNSTS